MSLLRVGIAGTGDIAPRYADGIVASPRLALARIGSHEPDRAASFGRRYDVPGGALDALISDETLDVIVNLGEPSTHAATTAAALAAGRHVYSEKPLAATEAGADALIALATEHGRVLACAPATILGPSLQTARAAISSGAIGEVVGASATMVYQGPELFHANPAALYREGAGPLFDMGVYDVAAMAYLLGPVMQVAAAGRRMRDERTVLVGDTAGTRFPVSVPTHVAALLGFAAGPLATMTVSFDGFAASASGIEIYGTTGTLRLPRSSAFAGDVLVAKRRDAWNVLPPAVEGWADDLWIIGLLDLAEAVVAGTEPRCGATLARHVLAVLHAIARAAERGTVERLAAAVIDLEPMAADGYERLRRPEPIGVSRCA